MTQGPVDPPETAALDPRTVDALRALLSIDADAAAAIRERTPARRRPVRQYGPRLDLGGADTSSAPADADGSPPAGAGPG